MSSISQQDQEEKPIVPEEDENFENKSLTISDTSIKSEEQDVSLVADPTQNPPECESAVNDSSNPTFANPTTEETAVAPKHDDSRAVKNLHINENGHSSNGSENNVSMIQNGVDQGRDQAMEEGGKEEGQDDNLSVTSETIGDVPHTQATLQLCLRELLSKNIAKPIMVTTDECSRMLVSTVKEKLELYKRYAWNGKKNHFRKVDFSLPDPKSYSTKFKSDQVLMRSILKLVCSDIVESVDELILPELDIELLHPLICVDKVLDDVSKCSSIEIPFTAKSSTKIYEFLPKVVKTLNTLFKPNIIFCKPADPNIFSKGKSPTITQLKTALKPSNMEACANDFRLTYHKTVVCKPATKRKSVDSGAGGGLNTKKRKRQVTKKDVSSDKKQKTITVGTSLGMPKTTVQNEENSAAFTFDSSLFFDDPSNNQQASSSLFFTAYNYWQLQKIHGIAMGEDTTIAIVDGGIGPSHPAFGPDPSLKITYFHDFSETALVNPVATDHGTMCAGIAAGKDFACYMKPLDEASSHNTVNFPPGVAPEANLMVFKILLHGETDVCSETILRALNCIREIAKNKEINVVSLSLGSLKFYREIAQVINELISMDIIVVCAASNYGQQFSQSISFPARLGHVLCIGSHGLHGKPSSFSPVGQQIDFLAPGEGIAAPASSHISNHYCIDSGTSLATPAVAGLICLILGYIKSNHPKFFTFFQNQWAMKEVLREISTSPGRHSDDQGFGALNPLKFFRQPNSVLDTVMNSICHDS